MTTPAPKTPLWKQLLGAVGGSAVALALYQGYSFAAPQVQALLTLPSAPNVANDQGTTRMASTTDADTQARIDRRTREIADRFGTSNTAAVEVRRDGINVDQVSPEMSSSSVSSFLTDVPQPGPVRPTGTISEPNVQWAPASSSSSFIATAPIGSENRVKFGPFGWLKNMNKFSSSSSVSSLPELAQVTAPQLGVVAIQASSAPSGEPIPLTPPEAQVSAQESSSSVAPWVPVVAPAEDPVMPQEQAEPVAEAQSSSSEESTLPEPYKAPAPLLATMTEHSNRLPQSGFGLETVAAVSIGAVVGRRFAKKRKV